MTLANLSCGVLAIIYILKFDNLVVASWLVFIGAVLDFFDGFAARLLKVHSTIGKELDSLADVVTFGVVPGLMLYHLFSQITDHHIVYITLLVPAFSALRLAKFNVDNRQSDTFIGLPTPANAIFIASLSLITVFYPSASGFILQPSVIIALTGILSYLLVAELPMFALKFKNFKWQNNELRFIFLLLSLMLLVLLKIIAIPLIIILYILLSFINNLLKT